MASLKVISSSIESIDAKKEDLRKAFEDLQKHSNSLASFTLQWKELEEYVDSIKSSLEERFKELDSKESQADDQFPAKESPAQDPGANVKQSSAIVPLTKEKESEITPRPELKSLCMKMDGKGLRSFLIEHRKELKELPLIRDEITVALKSSPDPAMLVLDAMQGFYPPNSKGDKDGELAGIRRNCILLLEQLPKIDPQIAPQVKEKAKKLAVEWKGKVTTTGENPLEALAFLQLLATYDLASAFNVDELLDLVVDISRRKQAIDLCRILGFTERIPDFIQKLTSKGKRLEAVKFVFAFELADKFPPVPILKTYIKESKKLALEIRKKGNYSIQSQNEATAKEIAALKAVIRYIDEHNLESQYPQENLEKRIEQLEKQKAERKRHAATPAAKKVIGNKRPRPSAPAAAFPRTNPGTSPASSIPSNPQTHLQQSSSYLPDRVAPYMGSAAGPYGLAGSSSLGPYGSSSSGLYGVSGNPISYGGTLSPVRSHLYPSEYPSDSNPPGLYDRPFSYGGYGLPPQYRPPFYQ